jgi:hypothetical protein
MIEVRPFKEYHLELLRVQGVQAAQRGSLSYVPGGAGVSAFAGDSILLCGGIAPMRPKVGVCWALLSERAAKHMTWLHYATLRYITMQHWQRLEAVVEQGFGPGCRWVELLGFHNEGPMPNFGESGETYLRYGRYG